MSTYSYYFNLNYKVKMKNIMSALPEWDLDVVVMENEKNF